MDAESASVLCEKIRQKRENINRLVDRIKENLAVRQRLKEERHKAKQNQAAAEKLRNVAMTALSILERPPCADAFFDNLGAEEGKDQSPQFLAKYKTKEVSVYDLNDGGARLEAPMGPPRFEANALLPKWQEKKDRIPQPVILPAEKEVGYGQEVQISADPKFLQELQALDARAQSHGPDPAAESRRNVRFHYTLNKEEIPTPYVLGGA